MQQNSFTNNMNNQNINNQQSCDHGIIATETNNMAQVNLSSPSSGATF